MYFGRRQSRSSLCFSTEVRQFRLLLVQSFPLEIHTNDSNNHGEYLNEQFNRHNLFFPLTAKQGHYTMDYPKLQPLSSLFSRKSKNSTAEQRQKFLRVLHIVLRDGCSYTSQTSHFPTQNRAKISVTISSLTPRPSVSDSAAMASSTTVQIASSGSPDVSPATAASSAVSARRSCVR